MQALLVLPCLHILIQNIYFFVCILSLYIIYDWITMA